MYQTPTPTARRAAYRWVADKPLPEPQWDSYAHILPFEHAKYQYKHACFKAHHHNLYLSGKLEPVHWQHETEWESLPTPSDDRKKLCFTRVKWTRYFVRPVYVYLEDGEELTYMVLRALEVELERVWKMGGCWWERNNT